MKSRGYEQEAAGNLSRKSRVVKIDILSTLVVHDLQESLFHQNDSLDKEGN
jgi:hypothetical protein